MVIGEKIGVINSKVASEIGLHVPCLDAEMPQSWGRDKNHV
jgi:hypothetical protein